MNQHDRTTAMQVQLMSWALPVMSVLGGHAWWYDCLLADHILCTVHLCCFRRLTCRSTSGHNCLAA